jgi:hypothetical protein
VGSFEVADRGEMFPVVVTTSKKGEWEEGKKNGGEGSRNIYRTSLTIFVVKAMRRGS